MVKRDALRLPGGMSIETGPDWDGRYWIGYRKGCSLFFRDVKVLRKWLGLPLGTPSRQAFDSWVESIQASDAERQAKKQQPKEGLTPEHIATGFGPEVHGLDESDPNHQTRTII
jgi:hypothetical protein